ncbi:MAG: tetratricopeptide repeat protein [Candidatus Zixiibacteriota bacterium]|nr:MAG: tetratricopeptide repeat protein [candidate division Zixibacteria bacterium]
MNRLHVTILSACALLTVARVLASFYPHLRLWGVSQLHYFPLEFRIAVPVIALLILIPAVNKVLAGALTGALARIEGRFRKTNRYLLYSAISVLSLILFWLLRAETPLLGDGYLRAGELRLGVLLSITEPLDFYLHLLIYRMLGLEGYTTYAVLSCLAGGVYVFLILLLSHLLGKEGREKLFIFLILATLGATQLFFGYVESYSFMYVALLAYTLFGIRYLQGRGAFLWAGLFLLLAASFHLSALFVLPSLFYLPFARLFASEGSRAARLKFTNVVILVCVVFMIGAALYLRKTVQDGGLPGSLLIYPFGGGESFYSFFSLAHFLDFLNHQLLISPVSPVLWVVLLILFRREIDFRDNVVRFLIWMTACAFGFALLVDPKLGYARDWDLFAFSGFSVTLLGLYLTIGLLRDRSGAAPGGGPGRADRGRGAAMDLRRVTLLLVVTSFVSTLPWILINATEQKAVARFEDLLRIDGKRAAHGYETMACYFRDKGEHEKTIRLWKNAVAIKPIPRYHAVLGSAYLRLKRYDEAIEALEKSIQMAPNRLGIQHSHRTLGVCLSAKGRYDEAVSHLRKAIDLEPGRAEFHYIMGNILGKAGRYEEAVPFFETAVRLNPGNINTYKLLGIAFARMGKKEEAKRYLETYLKSAPQDATGIKGLIDSIEIEVDSGR